MVSNSASDEELRAALDIEKVRLSDVINAKSKLQDTVGILIAGYDDLTNALGGDIDSMKDMTFTEKFVGVFSNRSARQMRERRVQDADIDTQLQDLVSQTQSIGNLLAEHADVLGREYASVGEPPPSQVEAEMGSAIRYHGAATSTTNRPAAHSAGRRRARQLPEIAIASA